MDQDYDPLAPPPSHNTQQDQTVPNLESGDEDSYDTNNFHQSDDPKNFHADDHDLPANFAKEAVTSSAMHRDDDGEDFYGQNREDDDYYGQNQHGQNQQNNPFGDESEEAMYYHQQQQQQQHQDQLHHQGEYTESDGGSSLGNSMDNSNPFAQSDSSYMGSSTGSAAAAAANAQRGYDQDFGAGGVEDDRPIMGGGYPQSYGVEGERSPMSDDSQGQMHPQQQQHDDPHRGDGVYDDEDDDDDEDEGMAREDIEERRLCESGSSLPEQDGSYGASPPEADRYEEQRISSGNDVAEGQRLASDDEYVGQGQQDEADSMMKMAAVSGGGVVAATRLEEDEDSDSERHAGNFEYNKMEEEETAEDVSGDEEVVVGGGGGGGSEQDQPQPAAGFDNHAFDDNDDEDAEVIQRKVDEDDDIGVVSGGVVAASDDYPDVRGEDRVDELDSHPQHQQEFENEHQEQQFAPEDQCVAQQEVSEPEGHFAPQESQPVCSGNFDDGRADDFGMGSSGTEDQQQGVVGVSEDEREYGLNPERDDVILPERSDNYMGVDCTGSNFGRGYGDEGSEHGQDEFDQSGGSDMMRREEEEERMAEEDRQMEYGEEKLEDSKKMEVEDEFVKQEDSTAVESGFGGQDRFDSNIDNDDDKDIDVGPESSGMVVDEITHRQDEEHARGEEEDYGMDYRKEENVAVREGGFESEEEKEEEGEKENFASQPQAYDDVDEQREIEGGDYKHESSSDILSSAVHAENQQQQEQQETVADDVDMYGGEREREEEEGEEVREHIEREEDQLVESASQSAVETNNTPSSIGGDFQAMTSLKEGEAGDDSGAAKPPRSFVDMIEDMASPETIPQPLPSPPKPESMSHEFDPLGPADNSDDERDEDDFIMEKQQQQQQQQQQSMDSQQMYQQHEAEQQNSHQLVDGGAFYETNHVTNGDAREESSEDLCLRAGEIEGETKFGVDGSAITTSADDQNIGAYDEDDASPQTGSYEDRPEQQTRQHTGFGDEEDEEEDEEEDDVVNAGLATDYTTTTTTTETTEERSGGDFDSASLGQAGFEQGFETGGGVDTDNALMSMSMEGSFYDDGGDLMGGSDGANAANDGSNLLIQSAITEVSEPTSSFSPHMDSVLRSEQQAFEEKLNQQNHVQDNSAAFSLEDSAGFDDHHQQPQEPKVITPEQSTATESAIPSGFEDHHAADPTPVNDLQFDQSDEVMGQGQEDAFQQQKQNDAIFDDNKYDEDVDVSSQPMPDNGGVVAMETPYESSTNEIVSSSSVDDPFGLQRNDLDIGVGGSVGVSGGGEFDSSSVDNMAAPVDDGFQDDGGVVGGFQDGGGDSSAVNGYHHEEESASLVSNEISDSNLVRDDVNSSAAYEGHDLDQGTVTLTDDVLDKTGGAATDDISISSAAEVSEISASQPAVSSSVDEAVPVAAAAAVTAAKTEKDAKKKPADEKEKKKTGLTTKTSATKTSTAKRPTSATTKTSTTTAAKKTTTTTTTTAKKTTTTTTAASKSTTAPKTPSSRLTSSARPTSASSSSAAAAKKTESPRTPTTTRKPASASAADKKATSPTKPASSTPGSAKPLPRYAQPVTPRKPRDSSVPAPGSADSATAKKTPTTRPSTTPTTPRTRPTSATTKSTTTSRLTSTTASTTSSPRPKTSPTKLSNGTTTPADKRSTSPTKRYTTPRPPASTTATKTAADKKDVKASPRTPLAARSPTKPATPRTPSTPRTGAAATNGKSATPKKPDYSNVASRIGSKDKMTHKPGGGNVKIESRKVKVEAKSKIGSLDNASHKPLGGDKKIETKKLDWKVESKIGSLDNATHVAGGGDKKIEVVKTEWNAKSKIGSLDNACHQPGGGDKKIEVVKTEWSAKSKIGSLDNSTHKPGGGDVKIESQKTDWNAKSRIGSLEKANHRPGGGDKKIETVKTDWNAQSKIGSLNNVKHKPGGGDKQIETHQLDFKEKASPKIGSLTPKRLNSSGSDQSEHAQLVVENGADGGSPV